MIRIKDLSFRYDRKSPHVLCRINLDIRSGEYLAVIGPNGSGKSTLLKHLNGLLQPTAGDIEVEGQNTRDKSRLRDVRQKVGLVFQNPDTQIVGLTVDEDVAFGPSNLKLPPREIEARVREALAVVGMEKHAQATPHDLSSGEKQLIAIAGVLAMNPRHIAFDEPTSYLDPAGRKKILATIRKLHQQGITIIHVTHTMDEIIEADRVAVLDQGRILFAESPRSLFSRPEKITALGLDIPGITRLMLALREKGMDVRPDILNLEEACRELSRLFNLQPCRLAGKPETDIP